MSANTSVVSDLRNHEGTKPLQMSDFATDIYVGRERRITLNPRHPPGHLNDVADHLPRRGPIFKTEYSLH